jgi:hypothetical protein
MPKSVKVKEFLRTERAPFRIAYKPTGAASVASWAISEWEKFVRRVAWPIFHDVVPKNQPGMVLTTCEPVTPDSLLEAAKTVSFGLRESVPQGEVSRRSWAEVLTIEETPSERQRGPVSDRVASEGFPLVLDVANPPWQAGSPQGAARDSRSDSDAEPQQSALGCAAYSWRITEVGHRDHGT